MNPRSFTFIFILAAGWAAYSGLTIPAVWFGFASGFWWGISVTEKRLRLSSEMMIAMNEQLKEIVEDAQRRKAAESGAGVRQRADESKR